MDIGKGSMGEQPGRTILVVDDEELIRITTVHIFELLGYRVLQAADGMQALEVYQQHPDEISLVLLDLTMPNMGGVEVLQRLRGIRPGLRILLTSGYNESDLSPDVAGLPGTAFIQKPFDLDQLRTKAASLLKD